MRKPVTTVGRGATSPETARTPGRSASHCATTVASVVTWPVTATPTSRSATPAAASDTSRNAARRSNATGAVRSATWRCTAPVSRARGGHLTRQAHPRSTRSYLLVYISLFCFFPFPCGPAPLIGPEAWQPTVQPQPIGAAGR